MNRRKPCPLASRIKKLMQKDEDVGKIAQATPVLIARAMELFLGKLCTKSAETPFYHCCRKAYVMSEEMMDFLKDTVATAPDLPAEVEAPPPPPIKRRRKSSNAGDDDEDGVPQGSHEEKPKRKRAAPAKPRGPRKSKKKDEEAEEEWAEPEGGEDAIAGEALKEEGMGVKEEGMGVKEEGMGVKEEGMGVKEEGMGVKEEGEEMAGMGVKEEAQSGYDCAVEEAYAPILKAEEKQEPELTVCSPTAQLAPALVKPEPVSSPPPAPPLAALPVLEVATGSGQAPQVSAPAPVPTPMGMPAGLQLSHFSVTSTVDEDDDYDS
eukprot:gene10376-8316_t